MMSGEGVFLELSTSVYVYSTFDNLFDWRHECGL